jgi:repressor of nif and glnA expression
MIEEILQAASPRALRQAEIRKALQEKGREVAFTSIRHALARLEVRNAAEQVDNSRTWRHRGGAS